MFLMLPHLVLTLRDTRVYGCRQINKKRVKTKPELGNALHISAPVSCTVLTLQFFFTLQVPFLKDASKYVKTRLVKA